MTTKQNLIKKLKKSKEYRDAFVDSEVSVGIPFQIKALREAAGWTQAQLADAASMKQPRICSMEQAGYGGFTLATLKKLASAFDVALVVRFAPFGELVNWVDSFSPDTFSVPSSADDPVLNPQQAPAGVRSIESAVSMIQAEGSHMSALFRDAAKLGNSISGQPPLQGSYAPPRLGAELAASANVSANASVWTRAA